MPATQVRAFVLEDPILVWLDHHGEIQDFEKDSSDYEFTDFIFEKGNQFESKWVTEMVPEAVRVCGFPWEVKRVEKVRETWELMKTGTPVIWQGALWSAPEKIYGVPDLIVHSKWLRERFPDWIDSETASMTAPNLAWKDGDGHYLVIDIKFTTELDTPRKAKKLANYGAQVRIYSYMLGQVQGLMPVNGHIVQRKPIDQLLPITITSAVGGPLDGDLVSIRDQYRDIKLNGASWQPWEMPSMLPNMSNDQDGPWHSAKVKIAEDYVEGSHICCVHQIGNERRKALESLRITSRRELLLQNPSTINLQSIPGIGPKIAERIWMVLEANRLGCLYPSKPSCVPDRKPYEFFVDFETFNNLNVDFEEEWPNLEGCEMIFLIGVGWEDETGHWRFERFIAQSESHDAEAQMIDNFIEFLQSKIGNDVQDLQKTALYHWSSAEVWQLRRAADRHGKPNNHVWRRLPWYDLQKEVFYREPMGVPGAWDYGLKEIAAALHNYNAAFGIVWPGNLDDGLRAMVMGWKAYQRADSVSSQEMQTIIEYNEVDCKAIWKILGFLRTLC